MGKKDCTVLVRSGVAKRRNKRSEIILVLPWLQCWIAVDRRTTQTVESIPNSKNLKLTPISNLWSRYK
jgi:hypothetical protein